HGRVSFSLRQVLNEFGAPSEPVGFRSQIERAVQRRRLRSARKSGGPIPARSDPRNGGESPVGEATTAGVIARANPDCPPSDADRSAMGASPPRVRWQQSQLRATVRAQCVAQQAATRSCAVSWVAAAEATWRFSAAVTAITTARRIPFQRTAHTLPPVAAPDKRGLCPRFLDGAWPVTLLDRRSRPRPPGRTGDIRDESRHAPGS